MTLPPTSSPERWERIQQLFHKALGKAEAVRASFLDSECSEDAAMRDEVVSLLDAHRDDGLLGTLEGGRISAVGPDQLQLL